MNKILCVWNGPGWIPGTHPKEEYPIPPCTRASVRKYNTELTLPWKFYLVVLFLYTTVGLQAAIVGMEQSGSLYCYSVVGMFYFGLSLFCIGLTWFVQLYSRQTNRLLIHYSDIDPWAVPTQILHAVLGGIYLAYGVACFQSESEWKTAELAAIAIITLCTVLFVFLRRKDMDPSRIQYGEDFEFAALSEQFQWELVEPKKQKVQ